MGPQPLSCAAYGICRLTGPLAVQHTAEYIVPCVRSFLEPLASRACRHDVALQALPPSVHYPHCSTRSWVWHHNAARARKPQYEHTVVSFHTSHPTTPTRGHQHWGNTQLPFDGVQPTNKPSLQTAAHTQQRAANPSDATASNPPLHKQPLPCPHTSNHCPALLFTLALESNVLSLYTLLTASPLSLHELAHVLDVSL